MSRLRCARHENGKLRLGVLKLLIREAYGFVVAGASASTDGLDYGSRRRGTVDGIRCPVMG